jgi:hypothetical protein
MAFVYVGIDPGVSGGIALLYKESAECYPMPERIEDLWSYFKELSLGMNGRTRAVIERVGGYVRGYDDDAKARGSRMFTFGQNYGQLLMALEASGIDYEIVQPAIWQRGAGVSRITNHKPDGRATKWRGLWQESRPRFKSRLKARAQELFPDVKVTLKTADALLIAWYARKCCEGRE